MSNSELGMLLMVVICLVCTVITVITAGRRIEEGKKRYKEQYRHIALLNNRLNAQKRLNIQLEEELVEAKGTALDYEKFLLDAEDEATAGYYGGETERNIEEVPITEIATELCKRSDVVHFLIDVKNDTQKYSLSGGH